MSMNSADQLVIGDQMPLSVQCNNMEVVIRIHQSLRPGQNLVQLAS